MKLHDNELTSKSAETNGSNTNKIELLKCPRGGFNCKSHLAEINSFYNDSDQYRAGREFQQAIFSLKNAFEKTLELHQSTCLKCAEMFREEIMSSLESMLKDMKDLNRGIFRKRNRYKESCILAEKTLKEFRDKNAALVSKITSPNYEKLGS